MSDSLMKPCPCCGQQEAVKIMKASEDESFDASNDDTYAIICDFTDGGCGCCGGHRLTLDEAIEVWNRRAPAQQPAAAPVSGDVALPVPKHRGPDGTGSYFDSYTADQLRTYGQQCSDAALDRAAVICEEIAQDHWDQYKGRGKHAPNNPRRADTHADGCSDGANQCAAAIRALKGGE